MKVDVAVVGAGIAGASVAAFLAAHRSVALLDRAHPGHGATGRSAGFLASQPWNEADLALTEASRDICAEVGPDGPAGHRRAGFLRVTTSRDDVPTLKARASRLRKAGIRARYISARRLGRRFPWMGTAEVAGGLHTPEDGYVDPYDVTSGLVARAKAAGCLLLPNRRVRTVGVRNGRVTGVETLEGAVEASTVVLATGAWTNPLLDPLGVPLALKAYRVQALVTAPIPGLGPLPLLHEIPEGYYLRPEGEGLLVGDGTEYDEADPEAYNPEADFSLYADLASWLSQRVPGAAVASVLRGWAGLCQATPDRLPLVGPVEGVEGLHVLAGFNGLGIMRAPALGRALAAVLAGRDPPVDLTPYWPLRHDASEDFPIREGFTLR